MPFHFDNSFARELTGFYQPCKPQVGATKKIAYANHMLSQSLGLDWDLDNDSQLWSDWLSGVRLPLGAEPIAQAYAGHQFGQFNPSLGDGRAVILGEIIDKESCRFDISLKGSGQTPFSRGGDGKAALGPMLREALISEAMSALGISTTRSLAVVQTNEMIIRDIPRPGAVLTRVASSHIRIGTFEYFSARKEQEKVVRLINYTLARHHHNLDCKVSCPALALLDATVTQLANLVADWMSVGFIHGVMNTDNISIAGETLDYGPCAFIDNYDPKTVFSSIDHNGRYSYGNQPAIAQWNLARLAEALLDHIDHDKNQAIAKATASIDSFVKRYEHAWRCKMLVKLGLTANNIEAIIEAKQLDELIAGWFEILHINRMDFTNAFSALADASDGDNNTLFSQVSDRQAMQNWLERWQFCRRKINKTNKSDSMNNQHIGKINPTLIPRNHLVEEALNAAEEGDMQPYDDLMILLQNPFDTSQRNSRYAQPADAKFNQHFRTYCGT